MQRGHLSGVIVKREVTTNIESLPFIMALILENSIVGERLHKRNKQITTANNGMRTIFKRCPIK